MKTWSIRLFVLAFLLVVVLSASATWAAPRTESIGLSAQSNNSGNSSYANVTSYGALCNGTGDDTAAIQAALASGQPILIPVGVCVVSKALYFGGQRVIGASLSGSILRWIGSPPPMPTPVSSTSVAGGVATVNTTLPHNLWQHETVVVQGNSNSVFDGSYIVQSVPSATSFTYTLNTPNAVGSGGSIGMYYLLDSSKVPNGNPPEYSGYNAGWVSNLTIDCDSTPGLSGLLQFGDNGDAINLHIENCLDGYTAVQTYMSPTSNVVITNSSGQGAFLKNIGANNGAATGGSIWANGFGTYGIHLRATIGIFDLLYAQHGASTAIYPFYFEGDGPGDTRSGTLQRGSCVADGAGGINSFYIRRYYFEFDSPQVATTGPSQDDFVFDDAWGTVTNAQVYPQVNPGFYNFKSLGNTAGVSGAIILSGGGGTIDPNHASDFSTIGFTGASLTASTELGSGSAAAPTFSFINESDLGWYRAEQGVMALGSEGVPVFAASPKGLGILTSISFCVDPVTGPCYGGFSVNGNSEIGTLDQYGAWGGGNLTAKVFKLGKRRGHGYLALWSRRLRLRQWHSGRRERNLIRGEVRRHRNHASGRSRGMFHGRQEHWLLLNAAYGQSAHLHLCTKRR